MEKNNLRFQAKYRKIEENEVRFEEILCDDAEYLIVAFGSQARISQKAIEMLRAEGVKVGMLRPITLWPFPEHELVERAKQLKRLIVVEHNYGQVLLTVEGIIKGDTKVEFIGKVNGTTISPDEIVRKIEEGEE